MHRASIRTAFAIAILSPLLAATASAQTTEYTVVRVDPVDFMVTARAAGSGEEIEFRLPASSFQGQKFNADLERVGPGQKFSARGEANSKVGGAQSARGGRGFGAGGPGFGEGPGFGSGENPFSSGESGFGSGRDRSRDPRRRDPRREPPGQTYQVSRVVGSPSGFDITAQGQRGETIQFRVEASAFEGYRFTVDSAALMRGGGFDIVAPNTESLQDCCTLTSSGG